MPVANKRISFPTSVEPVKDRKLKKINAICTTDKVRIKGNEIQKALSCDLKSKKKEKAKKSASKGEGKLVSKEAVQEKKNKSWNHFRDICWEISSKTFLGRRPPELTRRGNGKSLLGLSLSGEARRKIDRKSFLSSQIKQLNASTGGSKKPYSNEQRPEKSLSFQHLQSPKRVMDACKSISYIVGSFKKPDKNYSILQQYKTNLVDKSEKLTKHYQVRSSVWEHMEPSDHLCNLGSLCKEKISPVLSRSSSRTKPGWTCRIQPRSLVTEKVTNQSSEGLKNGFSTSDKGSPQNNDFVTVYKQTWQQAPATKENLKICQCPHFHTEEGIKKVCLQSSADEQEYGQKFFRVNYIPKEEIDDSDEEKEYVDKATTTEEVTQEDETTKTKPKMNKSESLEETVRLKTKDPEVIKKDSQRHWKAKNTVCHIKKCVNLKETPKCSAKSLRGIKLKELVKEKEVKNLNKAAAIEVNTLRKLFTKLNTVEHLLKEENCLRRSKNTSEKNCQKEKVKEMSGTDGEDECKVQGMELKAEIVRHVQNWLDAEFIGG